MKIEAFMTSKVYSVSVDTSVREAISLITSKSISGAPVLDHSKKLVTVVSEGDLLRLAASGMLEKRIGQCLGQLKSTKEILTLRRQDTFADAYRVFLRQSVHRIIIVDSSNNLQGIVSRSNVLKLLVDIKPTVEDGTFQPEAEADE